MTISLTYCAFRYLKNFVLLLAKNRCLLMILSAPFTVNIDTLQTTKGQEECDAESRVCSQTHALNMFCNPHLSTSLTYSSSCFFVRMMLSVRPQWIIIPFFKTLDWLFRSGWYNFPHFEYVFLHFPLFRNNSVWISFLSISSSVLILPMSISLPLLALL